MEAAEAPNVVAGAGAEVAPKPPALDPKLLDDPDPKLVVDDPKPEELAGACPNTGVEEVEPKPEEAGWVAAEPNPEEAAG